MHNRKLWVTAKFDGYYQSTRSNGIEDYVGRFHFELKDSLPFPSLDNPPGWPTVVSEDGTIDFSMWPNSNPARWNDAIDIIFSLEGQCRRRDGSMVPVRWAPTMTNDPSAEPAMLLTGTDGQTPFSAPTVQAQWVPGSNNSQILLSDATQEHDYMFRPAVVIPAVGNYYISGTGPRVKRRTESTADYWARAGALPSELDILVTPEPTGPARQPGVVGDVRYTVTRVWPQGVAEHLVYPGGQINLSEWQFHQPPVSMSGEANISLELGMAGQGLTVPLVWAPTADGRPPLEILYEDGGGAVPEDELKAEWVPGMENRRLVVKWVDFYRRNYIFRLSLLSSSGQHRLFTQDLKVSHTGWDKHWFYHPNPYFYRDPNSLNG